MAAIKPETPYCVPPPPDLGDSAGFCGGGTGPLGHWLWLTVGGLFSLLQTSVHCVLCVTLVTAALCHA